ncbi:MAG TPA: capsule assembly Wzi family protein [Candidatus Bathyarchaeia archaeon]|nr:capsule assembly Wzi family protein [Candidatus Bathyarchaeia archaeon]
MRAAIVLIVAGVMLSVGAVAQRPPDDGQPSSLPDAPVTATVSDKLPHPNEQHFFQHLAQDQLTIWTSPAHVTRGDLQWLLPSSGIAAGLFASDPDSAWGMASYHPNAWKQASNAALGAAFATTAGMYAWGHLTNSERPRETGVLATEAMLDVLPMQFAIRGATGRLRPYQSDFQNEFFQGGSSFPSNHAALAWAFAAVLAHEYPNIYARLGAYGLATAVSLARVESSQHFLSDVFIGGLIGYQVGRQVYKARHNPQIDDELVAVAKQTSAPLPGRMASTYVPLDSWVYGAIERLGMARVIPMPFMDLRPWTRMNCARMLEGLNERVRNSYELPRDLNALRVALNEEFADELSALEGRPYEVIRLDTVYTRLTGIAGQPLNDNNLGQTLVNNEGRPYQEGFNNYTGFSTRADAGRFSYYVSGEFQHAPSAPAYPLSARLAIASVNHDPVQPAVPFAEVNAFRLLDTYVSTKLLGQDISVGKQSLYWGPTTSGSMLFSNNAEPFWMLRINQTEPLYIPGVSKVFGPFRWDNFFGKLGGHDQFPVGPYIYGNKLSFKPFARYSWGMGEHHPFQGIEISFARTNVFAGQNHVPLTFGSFWNAFTSTSNVPLDVKLSRNDPGARFASFDFSWQIWPWINVYIDMFTHDEVTPLAAPRRAAFNPGLYLARLPGLPKLDLRLEGVTTNRFVSPATGGFFFYYEFLYRNVYVNNGNLFGSWIGRDANGYQAWSTWHFGPKTSLQFGYRNVKIAQEYIPQGNTQQMGNVSAILRPRTNLEMQAFFQYESWLEPVLAPARQRDTVASVQLTWYPGLEAKRPWGWKPR